MGMMIGWPDGEGMARLDPVTRITPPDGLHFQTGARSTGPTVPAGLAVEAMKVVHPGMG
tara:strand:- start:6 stop:182 length:177 start_codon:yes stop_codon:yes gene_type:complete